MTLLLLLLTSLAQQSPTLRLVTTRIWAPNQTVKPIFVTLRLRNEDAAPVAGAVARVVLTPLYRGGTRGKPPGAAREPVANMLEPWVLDAPVPVLAPGQTRELVLETPFLARGAFSTSGRLFTVENLIPNLRRSVTVQVDVELLPPVREGSGRPGGSAAL